MKHVLEQIKQNIQLRRRENAQLEAEIAQLRQTAREKYIAETVASHGAGGLDYEKIHFNDALVYRELERRGIALQPFAHSPFIQAILGSHVEYLLDGVSRRVPYIYIHLLENKFTLKQLLQGKGYPVCEGQLFAWHAADAALVYARDILGYPVVVKPTNDHCGNYVYCQLTSDNDFKQAFAEISKISVTACIIVEKYFSKADDYRFFLVRNATVSVVRRTPPYVLADGLSTVRELVAAENQRRRNPRKNCLCDIEINDLEGLRCLKSQKIAAEDIPPEGMKVLCRFNANVSSGGECENVLDSIHPSYIEVAHSILELFPELPYIAVDLLLSDPTEPATKDSYVVCECCCFKPGLSLHTHPSKGNGHDIITPLVDQLFPETKADHREYPSYSARRVQT